MEGKHFSTGEALRFGWNTFKTNVGLILMIMLAGAVIMGVPYGLSLAVMDRSFLLGSLCLMVYYVVAAVASLGFVKIGLKFVDGEKPEVADLWNHWEHAARFIWAGLVLSLLVMAGLFLFIIPGVIWMLKYYFVPYLVADKNMPVKEAFATSAKMTEGMKLDLFGMLVVVGLVAMAGYLALFIGIFVTAPVAMLALAYVYRTLEKQVNGGGSAKPAAPAPSPAPEVLK